MSSTDKIQAEAVCCDSCGIAEVDDIELKNCDDCDLVRYCSDKCQQEHRPYHKTMCKERAAKLRDEKLFRQPESTHFGDCPICFLPLSLQPFTSSVMGCCSKIICQACVYADRKREIEARLVPACPFCRHPVPKSDEEFDKINFKRIAANDPVALREVGQNRRKEGDHEVAYEYYTKAAELGDAEAHYCLAASYEEGKCVEKDEEKVIYHLEEAAIAGHPDARFMLVSHELGSGRVGRAVKHLIIAANLGHEKSMQGLKECYKDRLISKEDFAAALRANYAAVHATKSPQREAADTRRLKKSQIAG
mmetsp:Transcript_26559/g.38891  ORF Transcript_26559/g.38891 Transcript_26559/m.38891 type:complete len:306 (-) Transcript_26559:68-985(-)